MSSGCLGGGSAVKRGGAPGHAPRCVANAIALLAKGAKMA